MNTLQAKTFEWHKRRWIAGAKHRAKRAGITWAITAGDVWIPARCPVLGLALAFGGGNTHAGRSNSPSLDRIDPVLGYVPGNVLVVSFAANAIRHRATALDIARVSSFYGQLIPPEDPECP